MWRRTVRVDRSDEDIKRSAALRQRTRCSPSVAKLSYRRHEVSASDMEKEGKKQPHFLVDFVPLGVQVPHLIGTERAVLLGVLLKSDGEGLSSYKLRALGVSLCCSARRGPEDAPCLIKSLMFDPPSAKKNSLSNSGARLCRLGTGKGLTSWPAALRTATVWSIARVMGGVGRTNCQSRAGSVSCPSGCTIKCFNSLHRRR